MTEFAVALTRTIPGPREEVYRAFLDPELLQRWMCPGDFAVVTASVEAEEVCPSCSSIADGVNGPHVHLEHHDVAFVAVSRAPLAKIEAYRARMGWTFRWASSHGSDFNFDFGVSSTEERPLHEYNFRAIPEADRFTGERPGLSAFAIEDGSVFHTYSTYGRGVDAIWGVYAWLDRAPKGRNEDGYWHRRRDEYEAVTA